jgi:hypothetical protein
MCTINIALVEGSVTERKIVKICDVCKYDNHIESNDKSYVILTETMSNINPDYQVNRNIVYDYTLPRVQDFCQTCYNADNTKKLSEFVIFQINPLKYTVAKTCSDCIKRA